MHPDTKGITQGDVEDERRRTQAERPARQHGGFELDGWLAGGEAEAPSMLDALLQGLIPT